MKQLNQNRSAFHTSTLPPKNQDRLLEEYIGKKDIRETKEIISKLMETGTPGPDLLAILISSPSSLRLRVPETLYKVNDTIFYFSTDEKGLVRTQAGESSIKDFLTFSDLNKNEALPNYLFFDSRYRICINSKQAREYWHVSKSEKKVLTKFISTSKEKVFKLRVYWKLGYGMRFLLISSNFPSLSKSVKNHSVRPLGIYKHKTSEYNFAGRLLRTSFDPTLPNRSSITSRSEKRLFPGVNPDYELTQKFLLKFSVGKNEVNEVPTVPGIPETMEQIIKYLNQNILQPTPEELKEFKELKDASLMNGKICIENTLSELIVDFIMDSMDRWWFLKCKNFKTNFKAPRYSEFYHSRSLNENGTGVSKKSEKLEMASIRARIKNLGDRSKELFCKQKLKLGVKSIEESNKEFYSAHFSEINLHTQRNLSPMFTEHLNLYSNQIDRVAAHYDEIRKLAKRNKVETKKRQSLIENDQKIKIIVLNAIQKIQTYPDLTKITELSESFFTSFLTKVLDEEKTLSFFINFQAAYDWSISLKQFRVISNVFAEECKRFGLFTNRDYMVFNKFLQKYENLIFRQSIH